MNQFFQSEISNNAIFYESERRFLDPPCLTAKQEKVAELIERRNEIDSEILALLDEKEEIRDQLKEMGIFMTC